MNAEFLGHRRPRHKILQIGTVYFDAGDAACGGNLPFYDPPSSYAVETVTYARDLAPLPAPACASPRPASAASLTTCAGTPKASVSSRTIFIPSQARRLRASDMTPLSLTLPETQPATAVICPSPAHSRANATNLATPSFGSCGVFIFLTSPNTSPATAATRILVPPISITMYMVEIIEPQPRRRNRFSALLYRADSGPMSAYRLYQRRSTRSPASASPSHRSEERRVGEECRSRWS